MRVSFFGTHDFAATILQGLIKSPDFEVSQVITPPDRPVGRAQELQKTPVKKLAEKYDLPILQPLSLKNFQFLNLNFKLSVVAEYGLLIPNHIIETPKYGTINVHASLLPKYRGASPIQSALINGETETGVTIMRVDRGLDTGPILSQKKIKIEPNDSYKTLDQKLAILGLAALLEALPKYITGELNPIKQNDAQATVTRRLTRADGKIDWRKSNQQIYNLYRGLTPWPGIWTTWNRQRLKLLRIKLAKKNIKTGLVEVHDNKIYIGCGGEAIEVEELQLEGRPAMTAKEFLNGYGRDKIELDSN